jgi:hypothetical protein
LVQLHARQVSTVTDLTQSAQIAHIPPVMED